MQETVIDASLIVPTLGRVRRAINLSNLLEMLAPQPRRIVFVFQIAEELSLWEQGNRNQSASGLLCLNHGAAAARNFGAQHVDSNYLVFLDDDCVPAESSWLADLIAPLETHGALLTTGAVLGWDAVSGKKRWMTRAFRLDPLFLTPWGNPASTVSSWCDTVAGGNFAVHRSVFLASGGFSEKFGSPSLFEETELSLRICAGNRQAIWFSHKAAVTHLQAAEGGMRENVGSPSEEFLLEQKSLLLRLVFGESYPSMVRFELYRFLRSVRKLLFCRGSRLEVVSERWQQ